MAGNGVLDMTALESLIIVAVCAALGWVAARVYGWRRERFVRTDWIP